MRRLTAITALAVSWACVLGPISPLAQTDPADANRKVVNKVIPSYPTVARTLGIRGNVKVEVLVSPNGTVKSMDIKGGHPMLVQAATEAVRKWKWAPATHETKEPVVVTFDPTQ
jgi:TonB family protein